MFRPLAYLPQIALFILCATCAERPAEGAQESVRLWSIGNPDGNAREFAWGPDGWANYEREGLFLVGSSDPRVDWPYIHPGAVDPWAPGGPHRFRVVFFLERAAKTGLCSLDIFSVGSHPTAAAFLKIVINGEMTTTHIPHGSVDALTKGVPPPGNPPTRLFFPAERLRAGLNDVTIENAAGSWMVYDALTMTTPKECVLAAPPGLVFPGRATAPPLLKRGEGDGLLQVVRVPLYNFGERTRASVRVGEGTAVSVDLPRGMQVREATTPEVAKQTDASLAIRIGEKDFNVSCRMKPVRHWRCFWLPHSHSDLLWLRPTEQIYRDYGDYIEQGIAAAKRTASYGPDAQYKWNVEVLYLVERYLRDASPAKRRAFGEAVREGLVGLDAFYGAPLTALGRREEVGRQFLYADRLGKELGVSIDSAMLTDVPGMSWGRSRRRRMRAFAIFRRR